MIVSPGPLRPLGWRLDLGAPLCPQRLARRDGRAAHRRSEDVLAGMGQTRWSHSMYPLAAAA